MRCRATALRCNELQRHSGASIGTAARRHCRALPREASAMRGVTRQSYGKTRRDEARRRHREATRGHSAAMAWMAKQGRGSDKHSDGIATSGNGDALRGHDQHETNQPNRERRDTMSKTTKVRITFTESILGTQPADPEIHSHFIASKAPDAETMAEEIAAMGAEAVEQRGMTVFPRMEDGTPHLWDYQIKGFFKDACGMLRRVPGTKSAKLTAYKKVIDGLIFVEPRKIPLYLPMELDLSETDCQRPLRAQTPQGERIALAHSEEAPAGTWIEVTITCLKDADMAYVYEWLDYGALRGIGQWRNASHGRFEYEVLS